MVLFVLGFILTIEYNLHDKLYIFGLKMNKSWFRVILVIVSMCFIFAFILSGIVQLKRDMTSVLGYALLGFGLGGLITAIVDFIQHRKEQKELKK